MDHSDITGPEPQATKTPLAPMAVGLAIFFFFPVGLYLLYKHPVLSRNRGWWWAGGIWSFLMLMTALNDDKHQGKTPKNAEIAEASRDDTKAASPGALEPSEAVVRSQGGNGHTREEKSFEVSKGFGRGSLTVELPKDYDAGIALKDVGLDDSGSVEFTMTWFPERSDEPARRWSAYDQEGVVLVSGVIVYGRSIRGREPTRAHMLLGPDVWRKVKTVKVE